PREADGPQREPWRDLVWNQLKDLPPIIDTEQSIGDAEILLSPGIASSRRDWIRAHERHLLDAWDAEIGNIEKFLSAIPANPMWYCYLNAIPRVLASRSMARTTDLHFSFLDPGFSALAMFVVSVTNEIQQVLKLSTKEKIEREYRQYTDWVRYRI